MEASRYQRWWRVTGWLLLAVVTVNALVPWPEIRDAPDHLDKYLHAGTFFVLTVWFCGAYERERWPFVAAGLALFGAAIEFAQGQTGYRYPELGDMGANLAGIAAGLVASVAGLCRVMESWLPRGERA